MLEFARNADIVAPAGDLISKNAYDVLMTDDAGVCRRQSVVEGGDHLAFARRTSTGRSGSRRARSPCRASW
jgi:hypothetical protein